MTKIGQLGEKFVGQYLENNGYKILHYNWRCKWGEIDIIAQNKTNFDLIFVEVKTRGQNNWDENGLLAITPKKQAKIQTTAECFFAENPHFADFPCRFDVAIATYRLFSSQYEFTLMGYWESAF